MKRFWSFAFHIIGILLVVFVITRLNTTTEHVSITPHVAAASTGIIASDNSSDLTNQINNFRVSAGVTRLTEDTRLNELARLRAYDMSTNQYYSHIDRRGEIFTSKLADVGITNLGYSCENLLLTDKQNSAVGQWANSPAHNSCMSQAKVNAIGVAEVDFDAETGQRVIVTIYAEIK